MSLLVLRRSRHIMPSLLAHRHLPQRHLSSSNSPPSVSSELAHLATSKKITALGENLTSILEFTERNHATFNDYNWARLLNQLKRLSPKKRDLLKLDARFPLLLTNLSQALPTCSSTSTGSIVHSLTMLQLIATQGPSALRATIPPAVFSRITADADSYVTTATPSHIASLALAYATLHVPSTVTEPYFAAINAHAQALVDRSSTPPIVGLTTAFALTKIRGDGLFEHIRRRAGYLASTGTIPELAALLKAFAMQSFYAPALFRAASEKSSLLSSTGTASELADCIRSYGMMRFDSPKMLKAVSGKSLFILETGSSSDVSAVCVAFAHLNKVPSLFRVLEKNPHLLDRFIDGAQAPHLCSFVWSLSTLGLCSEKSQLLERAWDHTLTLPVHHFTKFELNQLAMVREFAWSEGVELREMGGNMKRQVKAAEVDGTQIYASEYEDLCSTLLDEVGFVHVREFSALRESRLSRIDMADVGRKIAVEYDGAYHYLTDVERQGAGKAERWRGRENGVTVAKRRLLQKLGWKVVNISYYDVARFERNERGGKEDYKRFLRKKISKMER